MASDYQFTNDTLRKIAYYSYAPRTFAYIAGLAVLMSIFLTFDSQYLQNPWLIAFLSSVCLMWPHIAFQWAKLATHTKHAVTYSLLFDAVFVGLWMPLISFELIPCAVFFTTIMVNHISAGGLKLFVRGLISMFIAISFSSLLVNPILRFESNLTVILACIPMITVYPMLMAAINYKLTQALVGKQEQLIHLSRHDGLTGVFSRHYWEQRLLEEFKRCQRSGEEACVLMVDIDNFKMINDTYGHLAGDRVLKEFGGLLQNLRSSDITGRYGGEEFAILLPSSDLKKSLQVAERLRRDIEQTTFEVVKTCTVSIGVAPLNAQYNDAYKWLDQADKALYKAKTTGRNRVCTNKDIAVASCDYPS